MTTDQAGKSIRISKIIETGVPQGSVLRPMLCIINTYDIPRLLYATLVVSAKGLLRYCALYNTEK